MSIIKTPAKDSNFHKVLFDPHDSRPDFMGGHQKFDAATSDGDWEIFAFTYDTASSNVTVFRKRSGVYDDRAALLP